MMESLLVPNDLQCHWLVGLVVKTLREEGGGEERRGEREVRGRGGGEGGGRRGRRRGGREPRGKRKEKYEGEEIRRGEREVDEVRVRRKENVKRL